MPHVVKSTDLRSGTSRTVRFEGADYGGQVSFFAVDNAPGEGPGLHVHPYSETWLVQTGEAEFTVGETKIKAGPGDIVVAEPRIPHRFQNVGKDRLKIICIHASDRVIQEWVEPEDRCPAA